MIQRSSTHIARSDTLMELALGDLYSERALANGVTTELADLIFASIPYRILPTFQVPVYEEMAKVDADFYQRLEKAGFMLDWGDDGTGLFMKYLRRGSGYYIDVGASELVANGDVKLRSGVSIAEIRERSVVLTDGSELEADLIVLATGYGSMNGWVAQLVSQEMADKVGKVWGLGSDTTKDPGPWEGEERNMWKPTQQEGLWFHGGNLHQSRHYSQFLVAADQGPHGGHPDAGLRARRGPPRELTAVATAIRTSDDGAVRRLTLCRPERYNTITPQLRDELGAALDAVQADRDRAGRAARRRGAGVLRRLRAGRRHQRPGP